MTQIASTSHLCFSNADFRKFIKVDNTKINNNATYFRTMLTYWFEFQMLFDFVRNCTDLRQCKSKSIQTNCLPTISKMKCVKRAAKYRHLDTNVCKFWANDTMIGCGSHNMNISQQQFSTLFNNFDKITIRMSLLGRISSFSNRFDWFWCHLRWKSMMVPT